MNFRGLIFITFSALTLFTTSLFAIEEIGTYTIIELDGRTFLLNTKTGECYRYFFNKLDSQGWTQTLYDLGKWDGEKHYQLSPHSKIISIKE